MANPHASLLSDVINALMQIEGTARDNASGPRPQKIDKVTGDLVRNIQSTGARIEGNSIIGEVESTSIYGRIHEEGGVITPKNAPVLSWQTSDGKWHHAMMVIIPPRPYLQPALESNSSAIIQNIGDAFMRLFA